MTKAKKRQKPRARRDVVYTYVYHIISITLLSATLFFTFFRFGAVFLRGFEALFDLISSVFFFFTEGFDGTRGVITPSVVKISYGTKLVFPLSYETFIKALERASVEFTNTDNVLDFLIFITDVVLFVFNVFLPLGLGLFLYGLYLKIRCKKSGNVTSQKIKKDGTHVQKRRRFYEFIKRFDDTVVASIKYFFKRYDKNFLRRYRGYRVAFVLLWLFNLNAFTIFVELSAYILYFLRSLDVASLPLFLYKTVADVYVATSFLPLLVEVWLGYRIFHELRYSWGESRLRKYIKKIEALLESILGAIFVVGKQRSRKTTLITVLGLIQAAIYRMQAKKSLKKCVKMFPRFPWRNVERTIRKARKRHKIYTLATTRKFIKELRELYYSPQAKLKEFRRKKVRELRKIYGYRGNNFIFGYRSDKYPMKYNDGRSVTNIFGEIEAYAKLYFIYSTPTPLVFSNYAVRTDERRRNKGKFELYDLDFINRSPEMIKEISQYSHIGDKDTMRLGRLMLPNNPYACAVEYGVWLEMEWAKEVGNQKTTEGQKKDEIGCNQKNDGHSNMLKTITHMATVKNNTYFRPFYDDHRPDSAAADYKELTTLWRIKETSQSTNVLPFFALEELFGDILTKIYDWFEDKISFLYGENAFLYLFQKLYLPFNRYVERLAAKFNVYKNTVDMKDGADDEVLKDKGKIAIPEYLAFSERFATDGLGEFFYERALKSLVGINDMRQFATGKMTFDEMIYVHSHFYTTIGEKMNIKAFINHKKELQAQLKRQENAVKNAPQKAA